MFMERAILHIDMDAFFAAVEVLDRPELRGQPVIVGGTVESRGVVCAASYEARRYGVHSAMSAWQARKLCPHGVFLHPRGRRYREISGQIFSIFASYTPAIEGLSLDEAFLDVTGSRSLFGSAEVIGRTIKRRIKDEIGLTASVGVAPNKFLAKLASDLEKPDGFVVIGAAEAEARLAPLPVGRLWGVGQVTEKTLHKLGLRLVRDLLDCPFDVLAGHLGEPGARLLLDLARGLDDRPVVPDSEARSIGAETTFARDISDAGELRRQLDRLADRVAHGLRKSGLRARTVHLKARYGDFTTVTRAVTLPAPAAATLEIRRAARELLEQRLERAGRALRLIGVSVSGFEREGEGQAELDLFPEQKKETIERLDHLLDALQSRFGPDAIRRGS